MTKISARMFIGIQGKEYISFGSGQPDLAPPKEVYEILPNYNDFKYGPVAGLPKLRELLSEEYPNSNSENFIITNGASEAIDLCLRVLSKKILNKKKVLITKPYYYSYPHLIKAAGFEVEYLETKDGKIIYEDFQKKIKESSIIIINSPSNPSGTIEEIETLKKIENYCEENKIKILSDEVYKDLIYERENYIIKGNNVITVNSFSKTYAMCGFRVGYAWSLDQELINDMIELKSHTSMNTNILGQEMALAAKKVPKEFIDKQLEIWIERRDLIFNGLKELGFKVIKPQGAFYILIDVEDPEKFVLDLFEKYKVITYPGTWFGAEKKVRLSYALDTEKIIEGLNRIRKYLNEN